MIGDLIKYVWNSMVQSLTRSSLTILSIMMGIMAIYTLLSFGEGLNVYIDEIAEDMGTDNLIIQPGGFGPPGSTGVSLTKDDLDFVKKQKDVSDAMGLIMQNGEIKKKLKDGPKFTWVTGWSVKPDEIKFTQSAFGSFTVESGRNHRSGDRRKAVLGYNFQFDDKIFEERMYLGDKIYVNGEKFEVIGFYEEIGNPQDDANVIIPLEDAEEIYDSKDEYGMIYLKAASGVDPKELKDELKEDFRRYKDQKEGQEDFSITTLVEQIEIFNQVFDILNGILILIAGISVLVAAVNIANTMYTAVMERTKEIGIMKAIGAVNGYILSVFVLESGFLGIFGGIVGVLVGWGLSSTLGHALDLAGYSFLSPVFPAYLTIGCIIFAGVVGTLSGFLPSRQASKLNPVDALRWE